MIGGIYTIRNVVDGKLYVGQTGDFNKRLNDHKSYLMSNRHVNTHLQRAWNKYGEESFVFAPFKILSDPDEKNFAEEYLISEFNSICDKSGYNLTYGGNCNYPTKEIIEKRVKSRTERSKEFYVINVETGEIVGSHRSIIAACREFGLSRSVVRLGLANSKVKPFQSGGYYVCFPEDLDYFMKNVYTKETTISLCKQGEKNPAFGKRGSKSPHVVRDWDGRLILQSDLKGNPIMNWVCQSEAARETNTPQANIWKCLNGLRKKAGGYKWEYN